MFPIRNDDFSAGGYVAPTVYLQAGKYIPRWNYYSTLKSASDRYFFLSGKGGADVTPAGSVTFKQDGTAQTMGINVDFYVLRSSQWVPVSYADLRNVSPKPAVLIRFYTTLGAGPYYAVMDYSVLNMAATSVKNISADKLAALDGFHREVQLLKYTYNSLVSFLNELSKRQLSPGEQQIFNEGILLMNNLSGQIKNITGIEVYYTKDGKIGLPVLLLIALIAILAGVSAWSVSQIVSEKEKTARLNKSYDLQKWVASKKVDVAAMAKRGEISESAAAAINQSLDATAANAAAVANTVSKDKTMFDNLEGIVKWGVLGALGFFIFKSVKP